jgi:hypothetical protein
MAGWRGVAGARGGGGKLKCVRQLSCAPTTFPHSPFQEDMDHQLTQDALHEATAEIAHLEHTLTSTTLELLQARRALAAQRELLLSAGAAAAAALTAPPAAQPPPHSAPALAARFTQLPCASALSAAALSACIAAVAPFVPFQQALGGLPVAARGASDVWERLCPATGSSSAGRGSGGSATPLALLQGVLQAGGGLPCRLAAAAAAYLPLVTAGGLLLAATSLAPPAPLGAPRPPPLLALVPAALLGAAAAQGAGREGAAALAWPLRLYHWRSWWASGDAERALAAAALAIALARLCLGFDLGASGAGAGEAGLLLQRLGLGSSEQSQAQALQGRQRRAQWWCSAHGACGLTAAAAFAHLQVALAVATLVLLLRPPLAGGAEEAGAAAAGSAPAAPAAQPGAPAAWAAALAAWWVLCSLAQIVQAVRSVQATRAARLRFLLLLDRCSLADASAARVPDLILALAAEERSAAAAARKAASALLVGALGALGLFPGFPWGGGAQASARALGRQACLCSAGVQVLPFAFSAGGSGSSSNSSSSSSNSSSSVLAVCAAAGRALAAHPSDLLLPVFAAYLVVGALPS